MARNHRLIYLPDEKWRRECGSFHAGPGIGQSVKRTTEQVQAGWAGARPAPAESAASGLAPLGLALVNHNRRGARNRGVESSWGWRC